MSKKARKCSYGGCNKIVYVDPDVRESPRCDRHRNTSGPTPKKVYHSHQFHKARYFYTTPEWRRLREWKINQNPLCEHCERRGLVVPATEVDHIVELIDGGSKLDPENLQSLCSRCHRIKTAECRRKREEKKKLNGFNSLSDF